jgi:ATP-dependent Lhr-like helicase
VSPIPFKKILVFCNSRASTEALSAGVRHKTRFRDAIFTHHGSLSKAIRERTESQFLTAPAAVCFATMTLEMGIDIGTVDYVLLADRPCDVPALLQRIGRGSRREGKTRAGYCINDPVDDFLYQVMFKAAVHGDLLTPSYAFRPSVLIQQALVLAGANNSLTADDLRSTLPSDLRDDFNEAALVALLDGIVITERLEPPRRGSYVLSVDSEARYNRGSLHSNISDSPDTAIVDRITGDIIGAIDQADTNRVRLGGGDRKIVKSSGRRLLTDRTNKEGTTRFPSRGFPTISFPLARRIVESTGLPPKQVIQFHSRTDHLLLHGFGIFGSMLLAAHLPPSTSLIRTTAYTLRFTQPLLALPPITLESANAFVHSHEPKLTRLTQSGPYHRDLPDSLRNSALASLLGLADFLTYYSATRLSELTPGDLTNPEIAEALG